MLIFWLKIADFQLLLKYGNIYKLTILSKITGKFCNLSVCFLLNITPFLSYTEKIKKYLKIKNKCVIINLYGWVSLFVSKIDNV